MLKHPRPLAMLVPLSKSRFQRLESAPFELLIKGRLISIECFVVNPVNVSRVPERHVSVRYPLRLPHTTVYWIRNPYECIARMGNNVSWCNDNVNDRLKNIQSRMYDSPADDFPCVKTVDRNIPLNKFCIRRTSVEYDDDVSLIESCQLDSNRLSKNSMTDEVKSYRRTII